jgi:hypothetical protein
MIRVSGVEPVRTLTGVAAEAVAGSSAATTKVATSKERDFRVKAVPPKERARV